MRNCSVLENQTMRRILFMACATTLAVAFTISLSQPAHAGRVTPPPVPTDIQVPAGNTAFLVGHAVGTQNYICLPCPNPITPAAMCPASGFAFGLFTPQATLFKDNDKQIITHYFSPNLSPIPPEVEGTIRATWQDSRDTSTVWAKLHQNGAVTVDPNAIAWLLLDVVGAQEGPTGGDKLTETTFIQRLNTSGGVAPSTGCASLADVGSEAFVPYTADYFFYKEATGASAANGKEAKIGFGFNARLISGFPHGAVFLTGGGAYDLATGFVHSGGGFSCLEDVLQGPLSVSINPDDPGPCLAGQGVRWDTAELLASTNFKCTGAATETLKHATTNDDTVVLQADFYRAGDGNDESFTAQMIVSETEIAPGDFPGVNIWVQGVGCGQAITNFKK